MKAVIPAAGLGSRMGRLTERIPKPMLSFKGKPILEHIVLVLKALGIDEFVFVVGYKGELIRDHFGDGSQLGVKISYVEQSERKGLAHAVLQAESFVSEDFVVHHGDNLFSCSNLEKVISSHFREKADATIGTFELKKEKLAEYRGGFVVQKEGRVIELVEKPENPPCLTIFPGFSILSPKIFSAIKKIKPSRRGELELPDAVNLMLQEGGKVIAVPLKGTRIHFTTPKDLSF